jgi:hypothetical protein
MNASESLANVLLAELRRVAGDTPMTVRIVPMQWIAIAKEIGLSDKARNEAITHLRAKGYIKFNPETTEIIALGPAGIEKADQLIREKPKLSDPMPNTLETICAELDYWESHLTDGEVGSNDWVMMKERINGLRHRENRFRPSVSITNNAIGSNPRINQGGIDQSVNLVSQGGTDPAQSYESSESDMGQPRFRGSDEPLGVFWSAIPAYIKKPPVSEIRLVPGPAMWVRLIPAKQSKTDLSFPMQVKQHAISDGKLWLSPLNWGDIGFIRADDGFGVYARFREEDAETNSVAFVFETGEIWAIDTGMLSIASQTVYFGDVQNAMCSVLPHYTRFLQNLGIEPPFQWIAGLDGIKGRQLDMQPPGEGVSRLGEAFLKDRIVCNGSYDGVQEPHMALAPFFREVFRKSSVEYPKYLQS